MAKYKREFVGNIVKSKTPGENDYIYITKDMVLKAGETLKLENKKSRLESLEKAVSMGKMSVELADKIKADLDKTPDFVRFSIVKVSQNNEEQDSGYSD